MHRSSAVSNSSHFPRLDVVLYKSTNLEMADLHVQRERVEHHGADEGDARRHGVHYLEFAARKGLLAGDLFGSSQFDSYSIVEMFIGRRRQH